MTKEEAYKIVCSIDPESIESLTIRECDAMHIAIQALQDELLRKEPKGLDEAAEEYAENAAYGEPDRVFTAAMIGFQDGAKWREEQMPKLPNNLDEASEEYAWKKEEPLVDGEWLSICFNPRIDAFKAGAEWMAGQYKTLGETEIYLEDDGGEAPYTQEWLDLTTTEFAIPEGFKPGDKVIVQIRKEE